MASGSRSPANNFPKACAGVVKENAAEEQIKIQVRIKIRDLTRHSHHLRCMLNQSTAACVVVGSRASGVAEARAVLRNECRTQRAEPRIANRRRVATMNSQSAA